MKADGRTEGQEACEPLAVERRLDRREGPAEAVAEEVCLRGAGNLGGDAQRTRQVAVGEVVEGEVAILGLGLAPVDRVDVVALLDQVRGRGSSRA